MAHPFITASPAKLNLSLRILGQRPDGFHNINSLMTLVHFGDKVFINRRADAKLVRKWSHPKVKRADDLCMKAAALLQKESGTRNGAEISVEKNIPIGGGLGGGSSNAASVLMALNVLWKINFTRRHLLTLARQLGSDVPFFIFGKPARASGAGDILRAANSAHLQTHHHYLLAFPACISSTAAVYAEYQNLLSTPAQRQLSGAADLPINNRNDLSAAVFHSHPPVAAAACALRAAAGEVRLSGSGACVYAAFASRRAAVKAQASLPTGLKTAVTRALWQHPQNAGQTG